MPAPQTAAPVLCALDFSAGSETALVRAADLAERFHTSLLLLHVDPLFHAPASPALDAQAPDAPLREQMRAFVEGALGSANAVDVLDPDGVFRHGEHAGDAILGQAEEVGARLIVMGTHGRRGVERLLMGSVAEEVVRRASCPVLVVPNDTPRAAPHADAPILVPVDFSLSMDDAVDWAVRMASLTGAPLDLLHVIQPTLTLPGFYGQVLGAGVYDVPALVEASEAHLTQIAGTLDVEARVRVRIGAPHVEIVEVARERAAGLIVMATRGLTGLSHALLGSVTERTLRSAPCSVLVVRSRAADAHPARLGAEAGTLPPTP